MRLAGVHADRLWRGVSIADLEFQEGGAGESAPKSALMRVSRGDALIGGGAYSPVHSECFPNGPCVSAESVALALN